MLEVIYHGHSFVEISSAQGSILIDPFITGNPACDLTLEMCGSRPTTHICITHGHADHVGDTIALSQLFPQAQIVTVYGLAKYLQSQWVANVHGFGIWGTYHDTGVSIKFFSAIHDGAILETGICTTPAWVLVTIGGKHIYHAGDTGLTNEFTLLQPLHIDLALLPIWGVYTMDVADAIRAVEMIIPKIVVPIHYSTWPKLKADDQAFARGVMLTPGVVPKVLKPGQAVVRENE